MAEDSFLAGLMLIVMGGTLLSFVNGQSDTLTLVLTVLLAVLVLVIFAFLRDRAKSRTLFLLFFLTSIAYVAIAYLNGRSDLVLVVVAIAAAIGFLSSVSGGKKAPVKRAKPRIIVEPAKKPMRKTAAKKPAKKKAAGRKKRK